MQLSSFLKLGIHLITTKHWALPKSIIVLTIFLAQLFLVSCSASQTAIQEKQNNIPESIHLKVIEMRDSYGLKCVKPILEQDFGASNCSNRLFQLIERRYGLKFTELDLTRSALELFEPVLQAQILSKINNDSKLKTFLAKNYKSYDEFYHEIKKSYLSGIDPFHQHIKVNSLAD